MGAAALPAGSSKHRGDGVLQPLVSIGGCQFHPAEPSSRQRPQEGQPEGAVLAGTHVHAQDLTLPVGIDPRRHHHHHHADVDDATALPNLPRTLRILSSVSEKGCNTMLQGSRKFPDNSVGGSTLYKS